MASGFLLQSPLLCIGEALAIVITGLSDLIIIEMSL